jgi:Ca2+-binding EF-hand superfamily protein
LNAFLSNFYEIFALKDVNDILKTKMSEEQLQRFMARFDDVDSEKFGELNLTKFKKLFAEVMTISNDDAAEMYFKGMDVENNKTVKREEFEVFVKAVLERNHNYAIKMMFRAFDNNSCGFLGREEIKQMAKYAGRELSNEEVSSALKKTTGDENGSLTYAQVVKLMTGEDIDPKSDPYDGRYDG